MIEIKAYEICEHHGCKIINGTHYSSETTDEQINALETVRQNNSRVRLFYGENGKSWHDEYNMIGKIHRSMGPCKVPILIQTRRSTGGAALLTHCVIGILNQNRQWIFKNFTLPEITLKEIEPSAEAIPGHMPVKKWQELKILARIDGKEHARFKTMKQAERWRDFMIGKRFTK